MTWSFEVGARTLYQEARGEPDIGRRAVAHVLCNRMNDGRWGHNLATVCLWPLQFSGWNVHDPNRIAVAKLADDDPVLEELRVILQHAVEGGEPDPTGGALFYFNSHVVPEPDWAKGMVFCGTFGAQNFYKEKK